MRMIKLRSVQSTHSLWKNWRVLATYMRRMRYNNLEIRIAGSSCRPQLISFFYFFQITAVFRSISQIVEQSFRSSHQRSTLLILYILKSVQNQIAEYWKTGTKNNDNKKVLKTNVTKRSFVDTKQSQITVVFAFSVVVLCLFVCLLYTSIKRTKSVQSTNKNNIVRNNYILIFKQYDFFFLFLGTSMFVLMERCRSKNGRRL